MKVAFLCRGLTGGGAERQMLLLARGLAQRGIKVILAAFYVPQDAQIPPGVRVLPIRKGGRWDLVAFPLRLAAALRRERPDVVHAYLPAANCLAAVLKPIVAPARIVFGVRASEVDLSRYDWLHRLTYRLERALAFLADLIIVNSEAGRRHCVTVGLPQERMVVIRNGIDLAEFRRDPAAGRRLRVEWGVPPDAMLLGVVARLDPMKGHEIFLRAFASVALKNANLRTVIVGGDPTGVRARLATLSSELGVADRVVWAGARTDMAAVYSALDGLCLPSIYGEGTPNVVGEAMACEVPCIVTDVGDTAAMVGDTGWIAPPGNVSALADAIDALVASSEVERRRHGTAARQRVAVSYSLERLIDETAAALHGLIRRD
ncbi:MAG TPA: glycosyltransferase [Alphaproteobacteria bacterium]